MKYKIGDVAKILSISPDLLRYYEKKGVVHPEKDHCNDYRYYDTWDINFLVDCLWFKAYGFGIDQIAQMVTATDLEGLIRLMDEKQENIQQTIQYQSLLLDRCHEYLQEVAAAKTHLYRCDIQDSPEIVRYINRYNFIYDKSPDVQQLGQQWLKYMPFTHRCFDIDRNALLCGDEDYAWGFSLSMKYVRQFQVPIQSPVVYLPSQKSIHTVFKSAGKNNFSPRHLDYVLDYASSNGYKISGGARGHLLCSVLEEDRLTGFFEVWVPIEDAKNPSS